MSEVDPVEPPAPAARPAPSKPGSDASGADAASRTEKPSNRFRSLLSQLRVVGRDVAAIARGRPLEAPHPEDQNELQETPPVEVVKKNDWRVSMMHAAAERLRGAADSYIAAKLDEIEARVDAKLDHVETRIDAKIIELHRQLREMRDRELRHRLRLLKITLIFTVLVALLSLGYKWLTRYFAS